MKIAGLILWDETERETLVRALEGHSGTLVGSGADLDGLKGKERERELEYRPVRAHLSRLRDHVEPYDTDGLRALALTYHRLIIRFASEASAEWWREKVPALSSPDAIEGLARERTLTVERCLVALQLVGRALSALEDAGLTAERPRKRELAAL